jgi:hypothetical protein
VASGKHTQIPITWLKNKCNLNLLSMVLKDTSKHQMNW